ncbi:MAG TPA: antitoxin [Candidatus Paceibacterota bacterium]|nr:antitoxin [Candidatus Paceibacterota bacterium]
MADLLIRDLTPEVMAALENKAALLGLSRVEYVRRTLTQEVRMGTESVTEKHLASLLVLLPDLSNEQVMENAWR